MSTAKPGQPGGEQRLFAQPSFPEIYERALVGPLFRPWVDPLLDDVELKPGDRVLDIACGTGIVSRIAKERLGATGTVVGVDLNQQMLDVARQVAPSVDWRQGDAGALPLAHDEVFDVVVSQQGFQFFPDRAAAAKEMYRALVPGGRLGVSTWLPDEEFSVLHELRKIAERHAGPINDRRHALGDPAPIVEALRDAGFEDIRMKRLTRTIQFADGLTFVRLNAMPLVSMSAKGSDLPEDERQQLVAAIIDDSAELLRANTNDQGFAYDIGTNVVLARAQPGP